MGKISETEYNLRLYYAPVPQVRFDSLKDYIKRYFKFRFEDDEIYLNEKFEQIDSIKNEPGMFIGLIKLLHENERPVFAKLLPDDLRSYVSIRYESMIGTNHFRLV